MQRKEIFLVTIVAIVLTNVSIIGTLAVTGYLSGEEKHEQKVEEEAELSQDEPAEPIPPHPPALHSMSQAMLVCVDKLMSNNQGKNIAFDINTVASRYDEEDQKYTIFIDTKTPSRVGAPQETAEVTCEVEAASMSVSAFQSMTD